MDNLVTFILFVIAVGGLWYFAKRSRAKAKEGTYEPGKKGPRKGKAPLD